MAVFCVLVAGGCGYDFGKFAPSEDGGSELDGMSGVDSGSPPEESGSDSATGADASGDSQVAPETGVTDYTVGGMISGLTGRGLQLANQGNTLNPMFGATSFTFPAQPDGSGYAVTVTTQPFMPTQSCAVMNGSGTIAGANVTNVTVTCTTTCSPSCSDGSPCSGNTDCASQVCTMNKCAPPACAPSCMTGNPCGANSDCKSGMCRFNNHTCR